MANTRQSLLGSVLKRIGQFSLERFRDRLRLQKIVYLLQGFDIYLGYNFNWYLYGPYSSGLTRDAFEVVPKLDRLQPLRFADQDTEKRFELFMNFLGDHRDDPQWLELVASLHMLNRMYGSHGRDAIFKKMAKKQPYLSEKSRMAAWQHLADHDLV